MTLSWHQLILSNLLRRPLRSAVSAIGVAIAVATLFCLVSFQRGYQRGLRGELDRLGAHLLVVPKGCPYDAASIALHGASWPCYLKSEYIQTIRQTRYVQAAAPVFMTAFYDTRTNNQNVYCGIEPTILLLKKQWRIDGAFPTQTGDILIGSEIARTHHWQSGQQITLPGLSGETRRICGILAPTQGADDLFFFLPMADAQRTFHHSGEVTHILVRLTDPERMEQVVRDLRGCDAGLDMTVVPLAHLFQTIQNLIQSTRLLLGSIALIALLTAGIGVSNTILMAVSERTREIGVLRAVGASPATIFLLIWAETLVLCLVGSVAGLLISVGGASLVEAWLRVRLPYAPQETLLSPEFTVALACVGISLLLGTLAAALPAGRAARLSPVEAMRRGA